MPKQKPTPEKYCQSCAKKMERRRQPNGDLEAMIHFGRRKFCNQVCMAKDFTGREKKPIVKWARAHARARAVRPKEPCVKCGSMENVDRHHGNEDMNDNRSENLIDVCRSCHMKEHRPVTNCRCCGTPVGPTGGALGLCNKHYLRFRRWGDPLKVKDNQHTPVRISED